MQPEATVERIRVRYGETDQMGHAYYGHYALWFEQARAAWCRARGFTYKELEQMGYMLPCVELHIKYRDEIRYDDVIEVHIKVTEIRRAAIKFEYEILNTETGKLCTVGLTWHVMMGGHRKAVTIPPEVRALLERPPQAP